jgi:hypothetical protein
VTTINNVNRNTNNDLSESMDRINNLILNENILTKSVEKIKSFGHDYGSLAKDTTTGCTMGLIVASILGQSEDQLNIVMANIATGGILGSIYNTIKTIILKIIHTVSSSKECMSKDIIDGSKKIYNSLKDSSKDFKSCGNSFGKLAKVGRSELDKIRCDPKYFESKAKKILDSAKKLDKNVSDYTTTYSTKYKNSSYHTTNT